MTGRASGSARAPGWSFIRAWTVEGHWSLIWGGLLTGNDFNAQEDGQDRRNRGGGGLLRNVLLVSSLVRQQKVSWGETLQKQLGNGINPPAQCPSSVPKRSANFSTHVYCGIRPCRTDYQGAQLRDVNKATDIRNRAKANQGSVLKTTT